MRIRISMNTPMETRLDMNYNYFITSLIYRLLERSNSIYSQKLHEEGYIMGNKRFKLFTFSNLIPEKRKTENNYLVIQGRVIMYISSPKGEFVLHLAEGLLSMSNIKINESRFDIEAVEIMSDPEFYREMSFTCLSPVTMSTVLETDGIKKTIPCIPGTAKYADNIKNNLLRKYHLLHGTLPGDMSFEMLFDENELEKFSKGKLIKYRDTYIKAYSTPFTIKGSTELIKVGYECGFGDKNSAGCGMMEKK